MSKDDRYFTAPLAVLRSGKSGLEALEACVHVGMVNAGLGYRVTHGEAKFADLLEEARAQAADQMLPVEPPQRLRLLDAAGTKVPDARARELWLASLAGWGLLGLSGGNRLGDVEVWLKHHRPGEVFFRIKKKWLWNAVFTARREAGKHKEHVPQPISWREFRLLAGILSAKVNSYDFTFCGWERVQATACGFHSKARFREGKAALPAHCQPLTRHMIRDGTAKLEALGFFARCRYSRGKVGGLMAYSFRHPRRDDLGAAIHDWDAANHSFKAKTDAFRASDLAAFQTPRKPPSANPPQKELAAFQSTPQPPSNPLPHKELAF